MPESVLGAFALIPLRAGSKGLPGKNTRDLAGRPLWRHAVDQARSAGIDRLVVSTDIEEVLSLPLEEGLTICPRPADLAGDTVTMAEVLHHVLTKDVTGPARVVLLQATSPLRQPEDIAAALDLYARGGFDLVLTATLADSAVLKWGRAEGDEFVPLSDPAHCFANRADLPAVYRPNGAVYVFDADWFRTTGTLADGRIGVTKTPSERALDIDSEADFKIAEARMNGIGAAP